jgi:hypothetical protein
VPPSPGADALARALARKVSGALDGPEGAFEATRWERASESVLVRPDYWRLDGEAKLRCVPVDLDTPRGFLREPGWLWTERGLVRGSDGRDGALTVRVRLPDGEYDVDAAAVDVPAPPWLFGYGRWLRKSFLEDTPAVFVPLGRVRAAGGWLRAELPASAAAERHVIGLRVTPAGMTPRAFGKDGEAGDDEQIERLRALGYVQ